MISFSARQNLLELVRPVLINNFGGNIMIITRFAPSPTGLLHVGNLRTALFNYLIAKQNDGKFILRLDDTDPERSKQKYIDAIRFDLEWLGLYWDQEEQQSNRIGRYSEVAEQLRKDKKLYECFESPVDLDLKRKKLLNMGKPPVYDRAALKLSEDKKVLIRKKESPYWRFLLSHERIEWEDQILGEISIDSASISDPVLIRADGQFLYTLASVIDDMDMKITNVVRGSDHVTNTATQIQITQALGGDLPKYSHHSLLTGPSGESLSKRLGTLSLKDLRLAGIEPMAILSHLSRLGSSKPGELFSSLEEIQEGFDISSFGAAPTKFEKQDLFPITSKYISGLSFSEVKDRIIETPGSELLWEVVRQNLIVLEDFEYWMSLTENGVSPLVEEEDRGYVNDALSLLPKSKLNEQSWDQWTKEIKSQSDRKGKQLFLPLRKALTGKENGPDMSRLLPLLKKIPAKV